MRVPVASFNNYFDHKSLWLLYDHPIFESKDLRPSKSYFNDQS